MNNIILFDSYHYYIESEFSFNEYSIVEYCLCLDGDDTGSRRYRFYVNDNDCGYEKSFSLCSTEIKEFGLDSLSERVEYIARYYVDDECESDDVYELCRFLRLREIVESRNDSTIM